MCGEYLAATTADFNMTIPWQDMFIPQIPFLESFIRGSVVYWAIFLMFNFLARRITVEASISDILVIVLIAEAASDAMTGAGSSITDGLIVVATIFFWSYFIDALCFYFKPVQAWLRPPPLPIILNGVLQRKNMRRQFLSEEELLTKLRDEGIERVQQVKKAFIEDDGHISIIKK